MGPLDEVLPGFEGVQFFRSASEAYAYAIEMRDKVPTARRAHIYRDGERSFNVYCHPLEPTVKEDGDFKRQNRNRSSLADCFYVGQTGLPLKSCQTITWTLTIVERPNGAKNTSSDVVTWVDTKGEGQWQKG